MPERGEPSFLGDLKKDLAGIDKRGHEEIRRQKRAALETHKGKIVERQEQMKSLITSLYETAYQRAGTDHTELLEGLVRTHQENFGSLDAADSENLWNALIDYDAKHKKTTEYFREYEKKPDELFERCFGQKPVGRVDLIAGPMTLAFRCFNEEDYIYAYMNYKHEDEAPKHAVDERTKAKHSQGVAFATVKVPELAGMVIMEKASNNCVTEDEYKKTEIKLEKNRTTEIKYADLDLAEHLHWDIDQENSYSFSFTTDKYGQVSDITLYDFEDGDFVFDKVPVRPAFSHKLEFPGKEFKETEYVTISVDSEGIYFTDHSRRAHVMENHKWVGEKLVVKDEKLSKRTRRHEEQHQFNKLFAPREHFFGASEKTTKISMYLMKSLTETMHIGNSKEVRQEAKEKIVETLARHYRRTYIDPRTRDEIIAYYKDGAGLKGIATTLKTSPLYDYASEGANKKNTTSYREWIENKVFENVGQGKKAGTISFDTIRPKKLVSREKETVITTVGLTWPIKEGEFTAEEVSKIAQKTLKTDYGKFIDKSLQQMQELEKLGYKRQEVVAFCNMLPARAWPAFVRRLKKSKTSEPPK